jgi:hypothetical protein
MPEKKPDSRKRGFPTSSAEMRKSLELQESREQKLAELILYISKLSEGDETFGSTKLNKLLFYSDYTAYLKLGTPITSVAYLRLDHGPAPVNLVRLRDRLVHTGVLQMVTTRFHNRTQEKPIALRETDFSVFSAQEISIVDRIVNQFKGMRAAEISDLSHNFVGWRLAKKNEVIPYSVARVHRREPTLKEIAYAQELVATRKSGLRRAG